MKKATILFAALIFTACATGNYSPTYRFNQLMVHNLTGGTINNVNVVVLGAEPSNACPEVNFNAVCDNRFGSRTLPQQGIELSWDHTDGSRRTETFNPPVPTYFNTPFPLRVVMEIDADGNVNPFYEQDEPRGGGYIN